MWRWDARDRIESAVDENLFGERIDAEGVAVPNHDIRAFAGLERADSIIKSQRLRGIQGEPADCPFRRHRRGPLSAREPLPCRLLIQALNAVARIGVHDGATALREIDDGQIFLNAVIGLHFEAPPIGPHRRTHTLVGQTIGDLVSLHGMMECRDLEAELVGDIEHGRHFIGAVAVHVHENISLHDLGESLELQIALRRTGRSRVLVRCHPCPWISWRRRRRLLFLLVVLRQFAIVFVPLLLIVLRVGKGLTVAGDVAHAGRGRLILSRTHASDFRRRPFSVRRRRRGISWPGRSRPAHS